LIKYRPCLADKYSWQPIPYDLPEGVFPKTTIPPSWPAELEQTTKVILSHPGTTNYTN